MGVHCTGLYAILSCLHRIHPFIPPFSLSLKPQTARFPFHLHTGVRFIPFPCPFLVACFDPFPCLEYLHLLTLYQVPTYLLAFATYLPCLVSLISQYTSNSLSLLLSCCFVDFPLLPHLLSASLASSPRQPTVDHLSISTVQYSTKQNHHPTLPGTISPFNPHESCITLHPLPPGQAVAASVSDPSDRLHTVVAGQSCFTHHPQTHLLGPRDTLRRWSQLRCTDSLRRRTGLRVCNKAGVSI